MLAYFVALVMFDYFLFLAANFSQYDEHLSVSVGACSIVTSRSENP
jgi:predicted patatin/cPLA2 family phospholipase